MISQVVRFTFAYNDRGYGDLCLHVGNRLERKWYSRSGSCNKQGVLVNAIPHGIWTLRTAPVRPVDSEYDSMYVEGKNGEGWKCRLWSPEGKWTHYLFHPDGGKPGTRGCIGMQKQNAPELKVFLTEYFKRHNEYIPVEVGEHYFGASKKKVEKDVRTVKIIPKQKEEG